MQVIKKNILAIICGVVALIAVVAIYWPVSGWYVEINESLEASVRTNSELETVKRQGLSCRLPIVDPQKTEAPMLEGFPTKNVHAAGLEVVKKMQEQSDALMARAIADNRRTPIDPNALPTYRSGSARATFKDNYYQGLEALKGKNMLNALPPPSPKDVADELAARWKEWQKQVFDQRDQAAIQALQAQFNKEVVPGIPAAVAKRQAENCTMYVSATGIYQHPGVPPQGSPLSASPNDVWAAQIGYWIQSDICSAIAVTNRNFSRPVGGKITVPNACVKRLVRTVVNPAYVTAHGQAAFASRGPGGDMPMPTVTPAPGGMQPQPAEPRVPTVVRSFQPTFTGRVSNDVYEVVHFSFTVDIEAANSRALLANLTNGRFITVLSTNAVALDRGACQAAGLLYGSQPVVQLTVNAEAVFFHAWTKDLMPSSVAAILEAQLMAKSNTGF